jgi:HEAT repeat protein
MPTIDDWKEKLKSSDDTIRGRAYSALLDRDDELSDDDLLSLLDDFGGGDGIARAIRKRHSDYMRMAMRERLGHKSEHVREIAVRTLARLGFPEDAPILLARLDDKNSTIRVATAAGLRLLNNSAVVPEIYAKYLRSDYEDPIVHSTLESTLEHFGHQYEKRQRRTRRHS